MKNRKRIPKHPIPAPRMGQESDLSNMETINAIENEMADDSDRESIEAVERDYDGRSSDEEDGAIPMDPADHDPVPGGGLRKPSRPPRHRNLRYTFEAIAEVLGVSRAHHVQSSVAMLRSLQTAMGKVHDIHKLRKELVAWLSGRPVKKRAVGMTVASELQKEIDNRMVEFKDHSLASEELLPSLQR